MSATRVLVAPDKFKGSLSALAAAEAIACGFERAWPDAQVIRQPIADGGEGFAESMAKSWSTARVLDPLGRAIEARCGWIDRATAVLEMCEASGWWRLAGSEPAPLRAHTVGTGQLIEHAMAGGASRILVGLGGSGTTDGGIGMAAALGYEFLTSDGETLEPWPGNLLALIRIQPAEREWPLITGACDVRNPLLGPRGTARMFAAQKGADARTIETLELSLEHLAEIVTQDFGSDFRDVPGAGAAGGLGFGLLSFCGAQLRPGFELVAEVLRLENAIAGSDLIVTGEGRLDVQTLEGKGPAGVAALARQHGKPVLAMAGESDGAMRLQKVFDHISLLRTGSMSAEETMADAARLLEQAATATALSIREGKLLSHFPPLSS